jgi:hypothetical protein
MFNGDFRRKPEQSLGGYVRNKQRDALIERAQNDRAKREVSEIYTTKFWEIDGILF